MNILKKTIQLKHHSGFSKYFANTSWLLGERLLRMVVSVYIKIDQVIVKEPLDYKIVGVCVSAIKQCEILHYINYNTLHFRYSYNHYSLIVMDHLFNDCGIMLACNTDRLSQSLINIILPFHE